MKALPGPKAPLSHPRWERGLGGEGRARRCAIHQPETVSGGRGRLPVKQMRGGKSGSWRRPSAGDRFETNVASDGGVHCRRHRAAPWISRNMASGVSGVAVTVTPRGARASLTAFARHAPGVIEPGSSTWGRISLMCSGHGGLAHRELMGHLDCVDWSTATSQMSVSAASSASVRGCGRSDGHCG
jgi:hypothetical protein